MISVCLATYNGERYIKEQIESILPQLAFDDEIIISDDGSEDNTIKYINQFNDQRIKIIYNKLNKGYTNNFENSINYASGDIIILSDQDDVWFDNKVKEIEIALLTSDFVSHDALFVNENLVPTGDTLFLIRGGKLGFFQNLVKSQFLGACMAFKRSILLKVLPFPSNSRLCPHDLWLTLIAEFYFKTKVIKMPLIYYRRHSNNVSNGGVYSANSIFFKLKFRCYTFINVLSRF